MDRWQFLKIQEKEGLTPFLSENWHWGWEFFLLFVLSANNQYMRVAEAVKHPEG